jgi:hypothetical protein
LTVRVVVRVTPPYVADIVTGVEAPTLAVVAVNVALVAPAATVTLAGTVATVVWLLERATVAPPVGAALERVTVPLEFVPPVTLDGLTLTPCKLAGGGTGVTVSVVDLLTPLYVAVIVTAVLVVTADVVAANVALVDPAAIITLVGTLATAVLLLESATTAPPIGAAAVNVAVPVEPFPPTTLEGLAATDDKVAAAGAACGVKRRIAENGPNTPAEFRARTRHHKRCAGRLPRVTCDPVAVGFSTKGAAIVDESSTWTS